MTSFTPRNNRRAPAEHDPRTARRHPNNDHAGQQEIMAAVRHELGDQGRHQAAEHHAPFTPDYDHSHS